MTRSFRILPIVLLFIVQLTQPSYAQNGPIADDLSIIPVSDPDGVGAATAFRESLNNGYDFLIRATVTKERLRGLICFTFGITSSASADPYRNCRGFRNEKLTLGPWVTITNLSNRPTRVSSNGLGSGLEALHIFAYSTERGAPNYTRLTPPAGIQITFLNPGADSLTANPPSITEVRYDSSDSAQSTNTQTSGLIRVFAQGLQRQQTYALLIDGIPFFQAGVGVANSRPTVSSSPPGAGYLDFTGFRLPQGEYAVQLAEYIGRTGENFSFQRLSDFLLPIPQQSPSPAYLYNLSGEITANCLVQGTALSGRASCAVVRGITGPPRPLEACSSLPNNQIFCSSTFSDSQDGSTTIVSTSPSLRAEATSCDMWSRSSFICRSNVTRYVSPHQNPVNRYDVDRDGYVSPRDAWIIINIFERDRRANLSQYRPGDPYYLDVTGDGRLSRGDALAIINYLGRR